MHETQTRVVDELTNSDSPTFARLMTMAERELGAFIGAVFLGILLRQRGLASL